MQGMAWIYVDPFSGVTESWVTSKIIDTRDAFDVTLSYYSTSGSASTHTYQVSNAQTQDSIAERSWSNWTVFGTTGGGSFATSFEPPLGYRFARILRNPSGASIQIDINKQVK